MGFEVKMREVVAFLVWVFSFWTWKDLFLRWLGRPSSLPASGEAAEHSASQQGQQESALSRFLSSVRRCRDLDFDEDTRVRINFEGLRFHTLEGESSYREFLGAVASSEIVFDEEVGILLRGAVPCKHVEAFGGALRQSGNSFKKLKLDYHHLGSCVPFAKCASSVLLGNDAIKKVGLHFSEFGHGMGNEEVVEFVSIIGVPHILRILKSFAMGVSNFDGEGMAELMKLFQDPLSVLEDLSFLKITLDVHCEHLSALLASSTTLKNLWFDGENKMKAFTRGCTSIATALCSNKSLESLEVGGLSGTKLKVLLDPLIPKNNNLQSNTTLTKLILQDSIGGKEGIETLVDMICTNTSLLELTLYNMDDFSSHGEEGIENVLTILEALKTNKSLKKIGLQGCEAVNGYKVLGAIMDLLLQNHYIEEIDLWGTGLMKTGDADYVYSELSKRKKVRLWSIVQGMANVNPTSARVFLCGNPYAGKQDCACL